MASCVFFDCEVPTAFVEAVPNSNSSDVGGVPKGVPLSDDAAVAVQVDKILCNEGDW